jgi:hypothetical protein
MTHDRHRALPAILVRLTHGSRPLRLVLIAACCLIVLSDGCRRADVEATRKRPALSLDRNVFHPYDSSRSIVDSAHIDLNGDGRAEFVIISRDNVEPVNPVFPREFDRIEIFSLDSATNRYRSDFIDPVESGRERSFMDVTGDGRKEIVVRTNSGGNDPVAGEGMSIYGARADGSFTVLFYSQGGSPELRDLNGDGIFEAVITGEYWGIMPHADAIAYTSAIHAFDGSTYVESNRYFAKYFDRAIAKQRAEYLRLRAVRAKEPAQNALALYRAFAEWLVWLAAKGDSAQVKVLWEVEKATLKTRLTPEQWDDLESLALDGSEVVNPLSSHRGQQAL